jgi:CubicO group peptidase (beta-lactamase class C family)
MPVSVAIAHADGPIEVRAFGALAEQEVAPESMLIDLGSVTKTITGVMAAKLAEQDKVQFDETLADFFGDAVPSNKADITLHQLLTHYPGFDEVSGGDFEPCDRASFFERGV